MNHALAIGREAFQAIAVIIFLSWSGLGCEENEPKPVFFCGDVYQLDATQVRCRKRFQSNLDTLKLLRNLEFVDLVGTKSKRIDPLTKLTKLRFLDLSRTETAAIGKLATIVSLRDFRLNHNLVRNVSGLGEMPNLERVELNWTWVADLKPLAKAPKLKALHLDGTRVVDISPLIGIQSLEEVSLWKTKVPRKQLQAFKKKRGSVRILGCEGAGELPCN
jgi:Leucine-rich repeat (LRR) protein